MVLQEGEDFLRWKERILKSVLKAFMEGSGFPSLQLVEVLFSLWLLISKRLFGFWSS